MTREKTLRSCPMLYTILQHDFCGFSRTKLNFNFDLNETQPASFLHVTLLVTTHASGSEPTTSATNAKLTPNPRQTSSLHLPVTGTCTTSVSLRCDTPKRKPRHSSPGLDEEWEPRKPKRRKPSKSGQWKKPKPKAVNQTQPGFNIRNREAV